MRVVVIIARILLGLIFLIVGLNMFVHFLPAPPITGYPATFLGVLAASHYVYVLGAVQVLAGLMLLTNQFVPLAEIVLAAVLVNIFTYHITMSPSGLPLPLFTLLLWFIVGFSLRSHFEPLFVRKVANG